MVKIYSQILTVLLVTLVFAKPSYGFDMVPLFSYAIPGSVEIYEGEYGLGIGSFATSFASHSRYKKLKDEGVSAVTVTVTEGVSNVTHVEGISTIERDVMAGLFLQSQLISSYNAYRIRGGHSEPYSDILFAPFDPKQIFRPLSVASLLLAGTILVKASEEYQYTWGNDLKRSDMNSYAFGRLAYMPAVSEEMFFRGYLNTELSKNYSPWVGVPLSSLLFASVHHGTGIQASAAMAGAAGFALAILQVSNDYSISQGVALHFWLNFLGGLKAIESGGEAPNLLNLNFSF